METLTRAGLLEVCINNAWGTVCDISFDRHDTMVACTQLEGFSSEGIIIHIHTHLHRESFYTILDYYMLGVF